MPSWVLDPATTENRYSDFKIPSPNSPPSAPIRGKEGSQCVTHRPRSKQARPPSKPSLPTLLPQGFGESATYHRVPFCYRSRHLVETVRLRSLDQLEQEEGELLEGRNRLRRACRALGRAQPALTWLAGRGEGAGGSSPKPRIPEEFLANAQWRFACTARGRWCAAAAIAAAKREASRQAEPAALPLCQAGSL